MSKKSLKRYSDFLNESLVARPKLTKQVLDSTKDWKKISELRDDFEESVESMADFFPGWFSDMCKKTEANPESDYQEMQKLLDKKGWDFESIKNLFSEEANQLVKKDFAGWFNSYGRLDSLNGHCDVYLYFTAKNLGLNTDIISLGGDGWANYNDGDEMYIRYRYGYHQTKYGQMMLKQIGYTVEQFREEALVYLQQDIKENWDQIISSGVKRKDIESFLRSSIQIKDYSLVEDDRMIIYSNEIANDINKTFPNTTTPEDISSGIVKYLSWIGPDIEIIDGDVVIWGKFKVDF